MTLIQIVFILVAASTLGAGILVVTSRNLIHSALWLVVSLFGVAVFFVLLDAGFLAVVQVIIYIGAIAILMIFAIMLTRRVSQEPKPIFNSNWIWALVVAVIFFGSVSWLLASWSEFLSLMPPLQPFVDPIRQLGIALVSPNGYLLAFELASVLLLAALIGAIFVAWERK